MSPEPGRPIEPRVAIAAVDVRKQFGQLEALRGATLELRAGKILALVGDNGAGKSTLLKVMCGALKPDGGSLRYWDETVDVQSVTHAHALGVYTTYQDLALAPDLSVSDNLFLGRELVFGGWSRWLGVLQRRRMEAAAVDALAKLGIALGSTRTTVRQLSGGQRQALAVAKAMTWATTALLMDEPTAALGHKQTAIVYDAVSAAADRGLAVLVVSHDIPQIIKIADRIAVMRHGAVVTELRAATTSTAEIVGLMLGVGEQ